MNKYIKNLPLFLYPYAYLLLLLFIGLTSDPDNYIRVIPDNIMSGLLFGSIIFFNLYCLFRSIANSILAARGKIDIKDMAKLNMLIKLVHIPAYIFNFILGACGVLLTIWGVGFVIVAVFADLFTIITTGINAIGLAARMKKEKVTTGGLATLYGFLNFVYCVDVVFAVFEFLQVKKYKEAQVSNSAI